MRYMHLFNTLLDTEPGILSSKDIARYYDGTYLYADGILCYYSDDTFSRVDDNTEFFPEFFILPYFPPWGKSAHAGSPIVRCFNVSYKKSSTVRYASSAFTEWKWSPPQWPFYQRDWKVCEDTWGKLLPYDGLIGDIPVRNGNIHIGLEVELEGVEEDTQCNGWSKTEDHSLKYYGAEFVTKPIKAKFLEMHLRNLFSSQTYKFSISNRCSIHLHLNVRDLSSKKLSRLIHLYCLYEPYLYKISGDRRNNNYCVPLYYNPFIVAHTLKARSFESWGGRYAGLNLLSYGDYGTFEFRMHEGTDDIERIMNFVNLILCIKAAVYNNVRDVSPKAVFGEYYHPDMDEYMNYSFFNYLKDYV